MKHILLVLYISLAFNITTKAQNLANQKDSLKNQAIYFNPSTAVLYHSATFYYERILNQNMWDKPISSFVKGGLGYLVEWSWEPGDGLGRESAYVNGPIALARYGLLFGKKNHHFEASGGIQASPVLIFGPSLTFGYRYQNPSGNLIIRSGLSIPEGLYLGVGFSF